MFYDIQNMYTMYLVDPTVILPCYLILSPSNIWCYKKNCSKKIKKKMFDSLVESFLVAEHIEAYLVLIEILEQNL